MYSYGTIIGGIILGYISDKIHCRAILIFPSLIICAALLLIVYKLLDTEVLPYYFLIFFIGIFLGGPYNTITSACAIDIAK